MKYGIEQLAKDYGFADPTDMLEAAVLDSVSPGICTVCGYSTDVEPDQDCGYCEDCGAQAVRSALILAGII